MYEIFVNGLYMDKKPLLKGALAMVSLKWHGVMAVEIRHNGEIAWKAGNI